MARVWGALKAAVGSVVGASPVLLALVALCAFGLGGLTLSRALPATTRTLHGTIVGWSREYTGHNNVDWNVKIAVPGRGTYSADSYDLYDLTNPDGQGDPVALKLRGSHIVPEVRYRGRWYDTSTASRTEDWIETYVLFTLGALLTIALVANLVRRRRARERAATTLPPV